jgi:glutamate dehydrogenase
MGKGLTRPELCVLLSYAKIGFTQDLLNSDIPDQPEMQQWVVSYFPQALQAKYGKEIARHKLRREIIAMSIANSLINRLGPTFIHSQREKTGATGADIARAYVVVREAFKLQKTWDAIEALDNKVPAEVQIKAMHDIAKLAEHAITWFLTHDSHAAKVSAEIQTFGKGIEELRKDLDSFVTGELNATLRMRAEAWARDGLPKELAAEISKIPFLYAACDITRISLDLKANIQRIAQTYYELGEVFHFDWLRQHARYLNAENPRQSEATEGIIAQLYSCQIGLTRRILKDAKPVGKNSAVETWVKTQEQRVYQLNEFLHELRNAGSIDLPMLVIADQRLRNLYGG